VTQPVRGSGPLVSLEAIAPASTPARLVSPSVESMRAYPPGKLPSEVAAELGVEASSLLFLAANENVLGPSPRAVEAAARALATSHLYPDGASTLLRRALGERHGVSPARIVVGNGSNDLIELLVRTFVGPDEVVATAWPSFVVYRLAAQAASRDVVLAPLFRDRLDLAGLAALVDHRTKVVFVANPNNPTGSYVTALELETFLARIPPSVIVVLDEAYRELVDAPDYADGLPWVARRPRTVVLRTFSKAYGLAGLRVGYGVMEEELADYLDRVRQPYNVSHVAQAAALAALEDDSHLAATRALAIQGRAELERGARQLGLHVIPSQANFVVIHLPIDGEAAQAALRADGILVRAMAAYAMPDAIRVTVGTSAMNARVIAALGSVLRASVRPGPRG
jgi:histidinol-phosphate aminotransferase